MKRILISVDLPDDEYVPEVGAAVYVGPFNADQEQSYPDGFVGFIVQDPAHL